MAGNMAANVQSKCWFFLVGAMGLIVPMSCNDSGDSRTTARVVSLNSGEVCLLPEDSSQFDLEGCFPISKEDRHLIYEGICIDVRIPFPADGSRSVYSIKRLERACRR